MCMPVDCSGCHMRSSRHTTAQCGQWCVAVLPFNDVMPKEYAASGVTDCHALAIRTVHNVQVRAEMR